MLRLGKRNLGCRTQLARSHQEELFSFRSVVSTCGSHEFLIMFTWEKLGKVRESEESSELLVLKRHYYPIIMHSFISSVFCSSTVAFVEVEPVNFKINV